MKKKLIALLLLLCITFTGCFIKAPENCKHSDLDKNGICDICFENVKTPECAHKDEDNDEICDLCQIPMSGGLPGDDGTCTHTDADDNGRCDGCNISVLIVVDFYNVNDLHGKLKDGDNHIGVDELTTYLKNQKLTDTYSIFLSTGDMWQGSSESNLTSGKIMTDWMNELDFVGMVLGNHEFDWGTDSIRENEQIAQFPLLAINVYDEATNELADFATPSVLVDLGPVQVGVIGAIGDCYSSIAASMVGDVYFKVKSQLTTLVKNESDRLREEGADIIVYALHDGYENNIYSSSGFLSSSNLSPYYDPSLSNGYVDIVFEAHTHMSYVASDSYGVYHLQGGGDNKSGITHAEIAYNTVTGNVITLTAEQIKYYEYEDLEDDPIVDTLLDKYSEELSKANEVLGTIKSYIDDTVIEQKVADLYYKVGLERWGDEYDIVLGGGFIRTRSPYNLYSGKVTYADVLSVLPFDNQIVLCKIRGDKLKNNFFETNNSDYYIAYGEYGKNLKDSINTNAYYYVVVDNYTSDYAWNGLTVVDYYDATTFARDLVAEYIKEGGWC